MLTVHTRDKEPYSPGRGRPTHHFPSAGYRDCTHAHAAEPGEITREERKPPLTSHVRNGLLVGHVGGGVRRHKCAYAPHEEADSGARDGADTHVFVLDALRY